MSIQDVMKELDKVKTLDELVNVVDRHPEYGHFKPDNRTFLEAAVGDKSKFPADMSMEERIRWFIAFFAGKALAPKEELE